LGFRCVCPLAHPASASYCGSCASGRGVASGFLPTPPRGAAVAVQLRVPAPKSLEALHLQVTRHAWRTNKTLRREASGLWWWSNIRQRPTTLLPPPATPAGLARRCSSAHSRSGDARQSVHANALLSMYNDTHAPRRSSTIPYPSSTRIRASVEEPGQEMQVVGPLRQLAPLYPLGDLDDRLVRRRGTPTSRPFPTT